MADHEGDVHVVGVGQAGVVVAGAKDGVPQGSPVCVQQGFHHEVVEQVEPSHSGWFARTVQGAADLVTVQGVADLVTVPARLVTVPGVADLVTVQGVADLYSASRG